MMVSLCPEVQLLTILVMAWDLHNLIVVEIIKGITRLRNGSNIRAQTVEYLTLKHGHPCKLRTPATLIAKESSSFAAASSFRKGMMIPHQVKTKMLVIFLFLLNTSLEFFFYSNLEIKFDLNKNIYLDGVLCLEHLLGSAAMVARFRYRLTGSLGDPFNCCSAESQT